MLNTREKRRAYKEEWLDVETEIHAHKPAGKDKSSYFIQGSQAGCITQLAGIMAELVRHHILTPGNLKDVVDMVEKEVNRQDESK